MIDFSNGPGAMIPYGGPITYPTSVGYSSSVICMKTSLDEMREARAWLEGIREKRKATETFIFDESFSLKG